MGFLRVRGIGKAYKRYARKSGRLAEWMGLGTHHELTWVLRDVSFDVGAGEAVSIVGANGAGKSTLLKIVAGTTRPTTGAFEVGGRVAALLELGIGFHPDFSGRQNVFMAAHLMGISTSDTASLMSQIEAFAEIGDYIDQPVRTYSSGMQVRLAFSVATAVRPDILIVDEALSVGDTYFQHKSFDRIRRFRESGTTLLFVSHSPAAIKALCDRALLMDQGVLLRDDAPDAVLDYYNAMIAVQRADHEITQGEAGRGGTVTRSGTREASIRSVELLVAGQAVQALRSGDPATLRLTIDVHAAMSDLTVGVLIRDAVGNDVFGTNTYHQDRRSGELRAGDSRVVDFVFPALRLGVGSFSVSAALHQGHSHVTQNHDWWDRALVFQVVPRAGALSIGVCDLPVAVEWAATTASPPEKGVIHDLPR